MRNHRKNCPHTRCVCEKCAIMNSYRTSFLNYKRLMESHNINELTEQQQPKKSFSELSPDLQPLPRLLRRPTTSPPTKEADNGQSVVLEKPIEPIKLKNFIPAANSNPLLQTATPTANFVSNPTRQPPLSSNFANFDKTLPPLLSTSALSQALYSTQPARHPSLPIVCSSQPKVYSNQPAASLNRQSSFIPNCPVYRSSPLGILPANGAGPVNNIALIPPHFSTTSALPPFIQDEDEQMRLFRLFQSFMATYSLQNSSTPRY